jgi:hypothetical protein
MRTILTTLLLVCQATPVFAQDTYTGAVFPSSVSVPDASAASVPPVTFPKGSTPCGLPKLVCDPCSGSSATTVAVRFEDPDDPTRDCEMILSLVNVPPGPGYRVAMSRTVTGQASIWSNYSNAFTVLAAQPAPHVCDGTAPASKTVPTGARTITICYGDNQTGGVPLTGFALYAGASTTPTILTVTPGSANAGGQRAYTASIQVAAGAVALQVAPVNAVGIGPNKSPAFTVTGQAPAPVNTAPPGTGTIRDVN